MVKTSRINTEKFLPQTPGSARFIDGGTAYAALRTGMPSGTTELSYDYSAVVGSISDRICEIRLAGKPPCWACSRTVSSSGATYTQ